MIGFWKVKDLYGEFSNWYLCEIIFDGKKFCSSEQLFMYKKAKLFHDDEIAEKILTTSNQFEIKKLGRMIKNFKQDVWDECCYDIMLFSNRLKYEQNPSLLQLLRSTGEEEICEASPLDKIWGIGLSTDTDDYKDKTKWRGKNLLGKVLMEIRSSYFRKLELEKEYSLEELDLDEA